LAKRDIADRGNQPQGHDPVIESCRSAALGGHVERCEDCGTAGSPTTRAATAIVPTKCQGAAAKDWLAAREADLLPVAYFRLVFTLPAEIGGIAYL
jgi:hypothetical protein